MICSNVEKARRHHMGYQNLANISGLDERRVHIFSSKWTIEIRMSSKKTLHNEWKLFAIYWRNTSCRHVWLILRLLIPRLALGIRTSRRVSLNGTGYAILSSPPGFTRGSFVLLICMLFSFVLLFSLPVCFFYTIVKLITIVPLADNIIWRQ